MVHYLVVGLILVLEELVLQDVLVLCSFLQILCGEFDSHIFGRLAVHQQALVLIISGGVDVVTSRDILLFPLVTRFLIDNGSFVVQYVNWGICLSLHVRMIVIVISCHIGI